LGTQMENRAHTAPGVSGSGARPRWSVMIPTYQCAGYLRETLAAVLAQDPGPERMQIEVVDDASSDDPQAVVEELGRGRVGFYRQPANVGHTANFNTCLERARGELVHLLHGDDSVLPGFYDTMERPFRQDPGIGAAFCRYIAMDEEGRWRNVAHLEQREPGVIPDWLGRIAVGQRLQFPSMVVARTTYEQLDGFDRRPVGLGEDWEMWVRIAARYRVAYEPRPLALYRVHSESQTGGLLRSGENARDLRRVIEINSEHFDPATAELVRRAALRSTALGCIRRSRRLLAAGDASGARAQVVEAIRSDRSPRVLAGAAVVLAARAALALGAAGRAPSHGLGR
jgi:glycosyltransferase involved in cell wall biosynthesis